MNSMPETTNPSTRINDSIVAAAIKALQPFHPTSAEEAAAMLLFWVRRSEMTEADVLEVGERIFPKPVELMDCPAWCETDHSRYSYNEIENLCEHGRDLLVERDEKGSVKVQVYLLEVDDLGDRRRNPAGIMVQADEPMSPDQAIRMIGAVSEGLRIIA